MFAVSSSALSPKKLPSPFGTHPHCIVYFVLTVINPYLSALTRAFAGLLIVVQWFAYLHLLLEGERPNQLLRENELRRA